ncbi:MAG TPA: cell envelope integrity protein TolA [Candidatus Saccharimonadales bacterium]|nr:cell envelope integrity protein TolA [Candidatus Saccharimonadales bacterium]
MNFSTPSKVLGTIRAGDAVRRVQGENRGRIMSAANCNPPFDTETAKKLGIEVNVNWGELLVLLCHARGQLTNAFLGNQYFFKVSLKEAPPEHESEWNAWITENINDPLNQSDEWFEVHNSRWSSVVAHGPGLMFWPDQESWCPEFCALADVRIATDTQRNFRNLNWISRRIMWTPGELMDEVFTKLPNNRWDKRQVAEILKNYKEINFTDAGNNYDIETDPEKYIELFKQTGSNDGGDALPAIPLHNFYFKDADGWHLRVVPEVGTVKGENPDDTFLWPTNLENDPPVAKTWREFVHCQHGDLSVDAPFLFYTERGLGNVLLEPTFHTNITRCRMLQHVNDNFNIWLRSSDNAEKSRVNVQTFGNLKVVKQGLTIIPQTERHQIQANLVEMTFQQLKQLTEEAAAAYVQDSATGGNDEETALKTRAKLEQVNAMLSSILMECGKYEGYAHNEICRRFCKPLSSDPDVKRFQEAWDKQGIPQQLRDVKYWKIQPVLPLGLGNPTMAMAMAEQLMKVRPMCKPKGQDEILNDYIMAATRGDWRKAASIAPLSSQGTESDAHREAVGYFAALMRGATIPLSQSNLIDQIEALLPLYAGEIVLITKTTQMADQKESIGLEAVSKYIGDAIKQLSQDTTQKAKVKEYSDIKMRQDNLARGLIQRGQQAAKKAAQNNGNGEAEKQALELKLKGAEGQQKMALKAAEGKQKLAQRAAEFHQKMHQDAAEHRFGQHRENLSTAADIQHENFKALSDAHNKRLASIPKDDE